MLGRLRLISSVIRQNFDITCPEEIQRTDGILQGEDYRYAQIRQKFMLSQGLKPNGFEAPG